MVDVGRCPQGFSCTILRQQMFVASGVNSQQRQKSSESTTTTSLVEFGMSAASRGCFAGHNLICLSVNLSVCPQKLAAIPVTAFVGDESKKDFEKYIRLCFIKVIRVRQRLYVFAC